MPMSVLPLFVLFLMVFCLAALFMLKLLPHRQRRRLRQLGIGQPAAPSLRIPSRAAHAGIALREAPALVWHKLFARRRRRVMAREFPQALDLLVLCLEAGLALDAALARICEELGGVAPNVARELSRATLEMRAGAGKEAALRALAARCGLAEIQACVAALLQAERFGAGIAAALRQHAAELRLRRRRQGEEAAAKLALKLLFPLLFCVFPSLLVVLLGPALLQAGKALLPGLGP
jgi:tight adherence protein C